MSPQDLQSKVIDFMSSVYYCLNNTTFANDRPLYQLDMVEAASWLIMLHQGKSVDDVVAAIHSPRTGKLMDWRDGECGKIENEALAKLRRETKVTH